MLKTKVRTLFNNRNNLIGLLLFLVFTINLSSAQITINKPILGFSEVCASSSFNTYSLTFTFSPTSNLGTTNIFYVELSDGNGNFTTPTQLTTSNSTTSPTVVNFSFPTNLYGTNYKIRIRSTAPVSLSPSSNAFFGNYSIYNQPFTINNNTSTKTICEGITNNLAIDSGANSPLQYSQLTYVWYRNNVIILGQNSSILPITQAGNYYCEVNYGQCVTMAYSNVVTVTTVPVQNLSITSAGNATVICQSQNLLLNSSITGSSNTYQWYKDSTPITSSNSSTYTVTQPGTYHLEITNLLCIAPSNSITVTYQDINVSLNTGTAATIVPGQNLTITCTTDATLPSYKWYKDGVLSSGQTTNSISVSLPGIYKVMVKQNSGCITEKEVSTTISYPTNYSLTIGHNSSYSDCVNTSTKLKINAFSAPSNNGVIDVLSLSVPVFYQWYKNNVIVPGGITNTLNIVDYQENGNYILKTTFNDGTIVTSNQISVKLKINNTVQLSSAGIICNNNPTVLITPNIQNNLFTYNWYNADTNTMIGTSMTYGATTSGNYYLKLSFAGCDLVSNTVSVTSLDDAVLITNYDSNIEINEGESIIITASGANSYEWLVNNSLIGTTNNLVVNQEQNIVLIAHVGSCTIIKNFTVTYKPRVFNPFIPNTITPNGDGKNDTWIIPEEYAYKDDVEIVIFSSRDEILFKTTNYENNWPINSINDKTVYYYKILKNASVIEKGTISVIR